MRTFVSVASGASTSSAFTLNHADRGFSVFVASLAASSAVYVQFAQSSGTPPWHDLARPDGSGGLFAVCSGSAPSVGYVATPPTPWGRLKLAVATSEPTSACIVPRW
jgi:hypothetical protein